MKRNDFNIEERIALLRREIERHNRLYYVDTSPEVSDFEFDLLLKELEKLEKENPHLITSDSPTQKVGSSLGGNFIQRPHRYPMLSLSNSYNKEELVAFDQRVRKGMERVEGVESVEYLCELKVDGSAISLIYREGRLVSALTRGDGVIGDDVVINIKEISSIPSTIAFNDGEVEVRGELYLSFPQFESLNKGRIEREEAPFANPRNATAGSIKLIDPKEVAERGLSFSAYSLHSEALLFDKQSEALKWIEEAGFPLLKNYKLCKTVDEVMEYLSYWDEERHNLELLTDGVVVKVNSLEQQRELGATAKSPRWATAYKFAAEQALSVIESVDFQTGRTGAVTPVANLKAVQLSGTTVRRASLHNEEQIRVHDLHIGDSVYVEKGGEIIPKIVGVELERRPLNAIAIEFPTSCAECGATLVKEESEARHYCPNINGCPMQIQGRFLHFCSRKALNILAGEATIDQLLKLGLVKTLPDLYSLRAEQLTIMEGWKERSIERFLNSVENSLEVPFERVLYGLGIRHIGESTAKNLALHFGSIESLMAASQEELLEVEDVGERIAASLLSFFEDPLSIEMVERLKEAGVKLERPEEEESLSPTQQTLSGLTIVISGRFSVSRDEIKELIEQHGGKNSSSISRSTSYLVAGEKMGPAKMKQANELGVKVIDEEHFFRLIGE